MALTAVRYLWIPSGRLGPTPPPGVAAASTPACQSATQTAQLPSAQLMEVVRMKHLPGMHSVYGTSGGVCTWQG